MNKINCLTEQRMEGGNEGVIISKFLTDVIPWDKMST